MAVLGLFISGCAPLSSGPDVASEEKAEDQKYSSAEVRRMFVDQPFLASGDYFRERTRDNATGYNIELGKKTQAVQERQESMEKRIARLEQGQGEKKDQEQELQAEEQGPEYSISESVSDNGKVLQLKMGLLADSNQVAHEVAAAIEKAARQESSERHILFVSESKLREVLAPTDCLEKKDLGCISRVTGLYPGVRMLFLVESCSIPESMPGKASLRINVVDTGLLHRYPVIELSQEVQSREEARLFLQQAIHRVLDYAADRSGLMPRHARVFNVQGERCYLSAGEKSGLKPGMRLELVSDGELVTSPTGVPVGWMAGETKGLIEVDSLFGEDAAACSVVEGEAPEQGDYALPKD